MAQLYDSEEKNRRVSFGKRLQHLRSDKKISQKNMAMMLGITPSAYAWYESGQREPSIGNLNRLAVYFGVSIDYLVNGSKSEGIVEENSSVEFGSVEDFWQSANYEIKISDKEKVSVKSLDDFNSVYFRDDDGFIKSSNTANEPLKFETFDEFVKFTRPIQENFRNEVKKLKKQLCDEAVARLNQK